MGKMQISFPYNGFISFEKYPEMDFFLRNLHNLTQWLQQFAISPSVHKCSSNEVSLETRFEEVCCELKALEVSWGCRGWWCLLSWAGSWDVWATEVNRGKLRGQTWIHRSAPTSRTYYGLRSWDPARRHLGLLPDPKPCQGPEFLGTLRSHLDRESNLGFHVSVKCSLLLLPGSRYLFPCRLPGPRGGLKAFV